jgi:hypothetical protein
MSGSHYPNFIIVVTVVSILMVVGLGFSIGGLYYLIVPIEECIPTEYIGCVSNWAGKNFVSRYHYYLNNTKKTGAYSAAGTCSSKFDIINNTTYCIDRSGYQEILLTNPNTYWFTIFCVILGISTLIFNIIFISIYIFGNLKRWRYNVLY